MKHDPETPEKRQNHENHEVSVSMCPCSQVRMQLKK